MRAAIQSYPPGQRGIDGGGFKVVTAELKGGSAYVYVMFESLRRGYVDDMEFLLSAAPDGGGVCNVRTSSRLGYLDMGVNAKRLSWFADVLGALDGWSAKPIRSKGHEEYFALNGVSDKEMAKVDAPMLTKTEKIKL